MFRALLLDRQDGKFTATVTSLDESALPAGWPRGYVDATYA